MMTMNRADSQCQLIYSSYLVINRSSCIYINWFSVDYKCKFPSLCVTQPFLLLWQRNIAFYLRVIIEDQLFFHFFFLFFNSIKKILAHRD